MTCCKKIPLPKFNLGDTEKLLYLATNGRKVFSKRYNLENWKSFPIITNYKYSYLLKNELPSLLESFETLNSLKDFKGIRSSYISILNPRSSIPWHRDMSTDIFCNAFLTSIKTTHSFIEFENDKKYYYESGCSYVIRSAISHRILNLSDDIRITLCTTPTENPYV